MGKRMVYNESCKRESQPVKGALKRMKRVLCALLALLMVMSMAACQKETQAEEDTSEVIMKEYDLSKFTVVRSQETHTLISQATASLYSQMNEKGITLNLEDDWIADEADIDHTRPEILLGRTNRPESEEAYAELDEGDGYVIKFFEHKIAIVGLSHEMLDDAVDAFVSLCSSKMVGTVLQAELGSKVTASLEGQNIITLVDKSKPTYNIVYAAESAPATLKEAVISFANRLGKMTGSTVEVISDYDGYDKNAKNIVIGSTDFAESKDLLHELGVSGYGFCVNENKIVIAGHTTHNTIEALNMFMRVIENQVAKNLDGSYTLRAIIPTQEFAQIEGWLVGLPAFEGGTYKGTYECGNETIQLYYTMVSANKIDGYVSALSGAGFTKREDHTIGNNRFVTCVGEDGLVHLTYLHRNRTMTVISDSLATHVYKESEPSYQKVTETTLAVSSLNFSHREILDGNGMSYVITLEDGRFVIIDGGYEQDCHQLYNYMVDNNKRSDGKIIIAAWILSHSHADHYGAHKSFTANYASRVQVEYFIANTGTGAIYGGDHDTYLEIGLPDAVAKHYRGAKIIKPHTGQVLKFCNVEFQILHTIEDYVPGLMYSENNASMVFRATINGQTILFMGDGEQDLSKRVLNHYGSYLKSDFLQVNHHGYSGGRVDLFQAVDPTYSMWTTSQRAFEKRVSGVKYEWIGDALEANKYLYDELGADHCFVADGQVEQITFGSDKTIGITYYTADHSKRS